jgi:hypothetical protein
LLTLHESSGAGFMQGQQNPQARRWDQAANLIDNYGDLV